MQQLFHGSRFANPEWYFVAPGLVPVVPRYPIITVSTYKVKVILGSIHSIVEEALAAFISVIEIA